MAKIDLNKVWALDYRLVTSVIVEVAPALRELGIECKELFLLAELDAHPHPAVLAEALLMPKPTVTMYSKRLQSAGFIARELDSTDLRRHRLSLTGDGRKVMTRGLALLAAAFGRRMNRLTAAQQAEFKTLVEKML
ncbi:MAG TPA: MarR family transcriptional regulator [Kofleriaceae bacterium]|jgi:DNA-binding MarR family transcriptional regulator|nr:MarR family transcriptional regulator [Kofleriaceae bacterium]